MRLAFRLLAWALATLAALTALGLALAYYLASRSLPDYGADWTVEGLVGAVEIVRDEHAVPHVFAERDADAVFALGWAHAQDRLWQMELNRRAAQGRLAELFGPDAVSVDLTMRALDLAGRARAAVERQSETTQALLDAYAAGVNARIRAVNGRALGRGAPEFFLFGDEGLAPWTPADSLGVMKLMAWRLSDAAQREARRALLLAQLSPEQVEDLAPAYPDAGVIALPAFEEIYQGLRPPGGLPRQDRHALSPTPDPDFGGASNAWAVAAERAAAGAPLLATDPHLWLSAPSVWMLARLSSPGFDVIGGSIPGIPAILIGRTAGFGWGLTTAHLDDQDIFLEKIDPDDPGRYLAPDGWRPFEVRRETIRVAGAPAVKAEFRATRHGPVMPAGADLDFAPITPPGHVAALAWTALAAEDRSLEAAHILMRATTIDKALDAAALHLAPAQNVVMADHEGVGMMVAGHAPLRREDSRSQGRAPSLGWLPENDWTGRVPVAEMPRSLRPRSGAVANANNRTTNAPFPQHLSHDWAAPYRIRRIETRLGDRAFHTRESFMEMQTDAVSEMARAVLPLIARDLWWGAAPSDGPDPRRRAEALALLAEWNGEMSEHDPEPLIFAAWMRALTRRLAADELGPAFPLIAGARPLLVERVFHDVAGAGRWCDVVKTPAAETCAEMARRALDDALEELADRYGADPAGWRWGQAHRAVHAHAPLHRAGPLAALVNIEQETSGGDHTIMVGQTPGRGRRPYGNIHAAGFRAVYDFADLDRSVFVIATGQSGHPLSQRYDDLSELWRRGDYLPMSLNPDDARGGALGVTSLIPAD